MIDASGVIARASDRLRLSFPMAGVGAGRGGHELRCHPGGMQP